ncbi:hypothetical protein F511_27699 [Dorcoceras hygrometricum]|uniref:Uncharacterized protein n=1 Tax=Dorcoceras hygrometricum TaxID=472368 RepID=A0A2Z7AQQ8_9LAMI|nr:hypothetical protein F511_27699 [Dorcoceras hygrometricum]
MSLFDLQDVCIAIGSIATLDLPMVVDLIGIFALKEPYCTLTMTDWFLQALSVIPRGSWGDVARRFTMIRWASPKMWFRSHTCCGPTASCIPEPLRVTQILENDDRLPLKCRFPREIGRSQAPRRQQVDWAIKMRIKPPEIETSICDAKYRVSLLATGILLLVKFFLYDVALSLAFGSSIDWFYCSFLLIVMSLLMSSSLSSPAGLLAPADLSSSADHDVVTDDIIIDAGSTWPPPDYEQLTQLWTSPLLIQLPFTMINQNSC